MANKKKVQLNSGNIDYKECLPIQLNGQRACRTCPHAEAKGDEACMSPKLRKTGKNSLGFEVPIVTRG